MTLQPAVFSPDRTYRYLLARRVGWGDRRCLFILLNPSTADEEANDPTIRRCMGFAQAWDCGILEVCNLFGLRSTDPRALYHHSDPKGPENDLYIAQAVQRVDLVICAWGNHGAYLGRAAEVLALIRALDTTPYHLGLTQVGQPRHPLYVPKAQELETLA